MIHFFALGPSILKTHTRTHTHTDTNKRNYFFDTHWNLSGINFINILWARFFVTIEQLFSSYILASLIYGAKISAKKAHIKCWWNWHLVVMSFHQQNSIILDEGWQVRENNDFSYWHQNWFFILKCSERNTNLKLTISMNIENTEKLWLFCFSGKVSE